MNSYSIKPEPEFEPSLDGWTTCPICSGSFRSDCLEEHAAICTLDGCSSAAGSGNAAAGAKFVAPPVSPLFPGPTVDIQLSQIPLPPARLLGDGGAVTNGVSAVTGRSKRSAVWDHYDLLVDEGKFGATVAKCLHCDQQIKGSHGSTSNFRTHLISKHTRKRYGGSVDVQLAGTSAFDNGPVAASSSSYNHSSSNFNFTTSPTISTPSWDFLMSGSGPRKRRGSISESSGHGNACGSSAKRINNNCFETENAGTAGKSKDLNRFASNVVNGENPVASIFGNNLSIGSSSIPSKRFRPEPLLLCESSPPNPLRSPRTPIPTSSPTKSSATDCLRSDRSTVDVRSKAPAACSTNKLRTSFPSPSSRVSGAASLLTLDGAPLADQMRPRTFSEFFGQPNVTGEKSVIKKLLDSGQVPSMIFWGPPGCGKTTLGRIIAGQCKSMGLSGGVAHRFVQLSAPTSSVAEVKQKLEAADNELRLRKCKTILFMDEIHRFNKLQQDSFLSHVEKGTVILIGATTENPSFSLNSALLSRCRVIVFDKLDIESVRRIAQRACDRLNVAICQAAVVSGKKNTQTRIESTTGELANGSADTVVENEQALLGGGIELDWENATFVEDADGEASPDPFFEQDSDLFLDECSEEKPLSIDADALDLLVGFSDGDARIALNTLQMALQSVIDLPNRTVDCEVVKSSLQRSHLVYDRKGDQHYDCISALHKSIRGSDANAALYWLARMLEGGEDPRYVARRLIRVAVEDVGMADPRALEQATAAYHAVMYVGMPECDVALAQAAVYMARAPKSVEVYMAYNAAKESIKSWQGPLPSVPLHLRNAPTKMMRDLGCGDGYRYNPAYAEPVTDQSYLPDELGTVDFFAQGRRQLMEYGS